MSIRRTEWGYDAENFKIRVNHAYYDHNGNFHRRSFEVRLDEKKNAWGMRKSSSKEFQTLWEALKELKEAKKQSA